MFINILPDFLIGNVYNLQWRAEFIKYNGIMMAQSCQMYILGKYTVLPFIDYFYLYKVALEIIIII